MKEAMISFGKHGPYEWKHIEIDYNVAVPILLDGVKVGAMLVQPLDFHEGIKVMEMHGIEIYPKYRQQGIAKMVVDMLMTQCDMMIGAITEDQPKPFWLYMKAQFRPIPIDAFGSTLASVHTDEPVFFFITDNARAKEYAEKYAIEIPKMMRYFNSLSREDKIKVMNRKHDTTS